MGRLLLLKDSDNTHIGQFPSRGATKETLVSRALPDGTTALVPLGKLLAYLNDVWFWSRDLTPAQWDEWFRQNHDPNLGALTNARLTLQPQDLPEGVQLQAGDVAIAAGDGENQRVMQAGVNPALIGLLGHVARDLALKYGAGALILQGGKLVWKTGSRVIQLAGDEVADLTAKVRKTIKAGDDVAHNSATGPLAGQISGPGQTLAGQIATIARMRPFADRLRDVATNPSRWKVVRSVSEASTNVRNKGGRSLQELLRNEETGETIVRHTLFQADGRIFDATAFS